MRRSAALLGCSHPLPCVAVTGYCAAVAAAAGLSAQRTLLLAAAVLAGQGSIGWLNDWYDAPRDRRAGRTDKPLARGALDDTSVLRAAAVAAVACIGLSLGLGPRPAAVHLVAVGSAWSYDVRLKETRASPLPFFVSFGLVPVVMVATALPHSPAPRPWVAVASGLLGVAAHFANTVADVESDALTGIRGLPQRWGPRRSLFACFGLVVVATALLVAGTRAAVPATVAGGLVTVATGTAGILLPRRPRAVFPLLLLAVAALLAGLIASGADHLLAG